MQFLGSGPASVGTLSREVCCRSQGGDRPGGVPVASAEWTPEAGRVCQACGGEAFGQQEQGSARTPFVVLSPRSYSTSGLPVTRARVVGPNEAFYGLTFPRLPQEIQQVQEHSAQLPRDSA